MTGKLVDKGQWASPDTEQKECFFPSLRSPEGGENRGQPYGWRGDVGQGVWSMAHRLQLLTSFIGACLQATVETCAGEGLSWSWCETPKTQAQLAVPPGRAGDALSSALSLASPQEPSWSHTQKPTVEIEYLCPLRYTWKEQKRGRSVLIL